MTNKEKIEHFEINIERINSLITIVFDHFFEDRISTHEYGNFGNLILVALEKIADLQEDIHTLLLADDELPKAII